MAHDIFLSYSGHDSDFAQELHRRLQRFRVEGRRLQIFFAPAAIAPGESIPRALSTALQACRHLVPLITPSWIDSEWCRLEHEVGVWLDPGATDRRLLPCLLSDTRLPPDLARISYIDFRDPARFDSALRVLVDAVRSSLVRRARQHEAVLAQRAVLHAPLLPWIGFGGPSFDFLWPEMIVDPEVVMRRHPGPRSQVSAWLAGERSRHESMFAVVGDAGAGKTTMLRSLLLTGGRRLPAQRVLVHARELVDPPASLVRQIDQSEPAGLALLVDGLDEAGAENVASVVAGLAAIRKDNTFVVMAARTDFFDRQYDLVVPGLDEFADILELQPWRNSDILDFARRYAERIGEPAVGSGVAGIMEAVPGVQQLLANPMRLTLVLFLLASGLHLDASALREPYTLYTSFYAEWLRKERQRGTSSRSADVVRRAHVVLARWLYSHRAERGRLDQLLAGVEDGAPGALDTRGLMADSAFTGLLIIESDVDGSQVLSGFRHETIAEYLIAGDILRAFEGSGSTMDEALRYTVGDDVNNFVRSGLREAGPDKVEALLRNLSDRYHELIPDGLDSLPAARLREQLLYYIGRLPLTTLPTVLQFAYSHEPDPLLRRSAALGAILHGDDEIEEDYLSRLVRDDEARLNRSVQLVYFGDVNADLHTFLDAGQDWSRTRAVIFTRLRGSSARDIRLRWWDLRTLRSFQSSRSTFTALSDAELATLHTLDLTGHGSAERVRKLQEELGELIRWIDGEVDGRTV